MKIYSAYSPNGLNKQGLGPVVIVVRIGRNYVKHISTGIKIPPSDWDKKKGLVKAGTPNVYSYNDTIKRLMNQLDLWAIQTTAAGYEITPEKFAEFFQKPEKPSDMFVKFYKTTLTNDRTLKHSSFTDQNQTLDLLTKFNSGIKLAELNRRFVDGFENWMIENGLAQNTRKKHHKNIKKYINKAIDYGMMKVTLDGHPYRSVRFPTKPTTREFLTVDEVTRIESLEIAGTYAQVRDLFLFCCYTGLRFSDSQMITPDNFKGSTLEYVPQKTEKHTGKAIVPLREYWSGKGLILAERLNYQLLRITNQEANRYLKNIMVDAEIRKLLTFHVGRHTFLTHVAATTGNVFKVMKAGGLRKTDTAMIYIHLAGVE